MPIEPRQKALKPKRDRTGYVMVELTSGERKKLERLKAKRESKSGDRVSLAGTLRELLRAAKE